MRKYAKIGLVIGAVGVVGTAAAVVRSLAKKAFHNGFDSGLTMGMCVADKAVADAAKKYNNLVDEYNELVEDYCELFDDVDFDVAKIGESEDDSEE